LVLDGQKTNTKHLISHLKIEAKEQMSISKKVWTEDIVEFKGQFYNIPASKIGPKPIQKPYIPIYLGGLVKEHLQE
jgi:alkanesulfonate monooxygenase SsuD/methylene tetrahydromethanopterin reductase-like flavin-dependent oxidoreductase (luciferase family)